MRPHSSFAGWFVFALIGFGPVIADAASADAKLEFNRDIRPILSDHCFRCHGPDKGHRKAKLRLDLREVALEREAFVPGKPEESELIRRINAIGTDDLMPPEDMHKPLSPAQKDLLKRWIVEGAEYQPHWAYIVPKRPVVPAASNQFSVSSVQNRKSDRTTGGKLMTDSLNTENSSQSRNPIDAFIRRELEVRKIRPSPEADRRTLLRRLSLDLIGLPPTPEETELFLKDKSPNAYEKQVERLLASPHYGERMAATWLDLARYADTVGYHGDQNQNVFPYRDYVINAFNANKPFDQFTIEQLAGDLLPNPTVEQKTATAFNRLNMMTREGGAQPKEYLAKYAGDRVRTVSTTWLGSTMGCAECHDHKYDPFSAKDFYSLAAYFADVKQWGVYADYAYTPNPDLKGVGNDHPFPPEIEVDSPALRNRIHQLRLRRENAHAAAWEKLRADKAGRSAFEQWQTQSRAFLKQNPDGWLSPDPSLVLKLKNTNAVTATNFSVQADGGITFTREAHASTTVKLLLTNQWLAAIRVQVTPHEAAGEAAKTARRPRRVASDINLSATLRNGDQNAKLTFHFAEADAKQPRYSAGQTILGVKDVWRLSTEQEQQTAVWQLDRPLHISSNATLTVNLGTADVASLRVSVTPFAADDVLEAGGGAELRAALGRSGFSRAKTETRLIERTFLQSTDRAPDFLKRAHELQRDIFECRNGRAFVQITESREPLVTRVLPRGNWQDETGEIVQPTPPHFLPGAQPGTGTDGRTRLDLARWLVSPENPLTARTFVNRLWKQYFGMGLSAVVDDLGAQGETPTHPELLDWLAVEFRESGWDVKHIVKLIVSSATYRQAAGPRPELKDIDPNNRLLASQTPRRLEAELVRDNALAVAGLLNPELGGPSVHPYQPPDYYVNLQFPDRDYYASTDDRQYRRGVYAWWQRTFLQPMLANFDAPAREECTAIRNASNTPQQALTLLNDPTFVEASRVFVGKILTAKAATDEQRFDLAFRRALARAPKTAERESLTRFLAEQRSYYVANPEEAKKLLRVGLASEPTVANESELAAWTQVCRVVLNLHETITRY